ncbi:MAG TPA: hypothetical protein VFN97_22250 [Actinospica sp.]|nr:hypothetical protein [Actinospica sp.]
MEGIRYRTGLTRVVVDREGIAVHRFWRGSIALPWELISRVGVAKWPWSNEWAVHVELVDGHRSTLPAPAGNPDPYDAALRRAEYEIRRFQIEADAARAAGEPKDEVPAEYRAVAAGRLAYSGGARRNGALLAMIAALGLLGLLVMGVSVRNEFGSLSPAFTPQPCSASAAGFGDADHEWCSVDGYVREIDHPSAGRLTLWLGDAPTTGQDAQSGALPADFATVAPALNSLHVGDRVHYIAESGMSVESVSFAGQTFAARDWTLAPEGTPAGQQLADRAGSIAALCWLLFFGLWAADQRCPGRLRRARWALPVLAALWLAGMSGYATYGSAIPAPAPHRFVERAAVLCAVAVAVYAVALTARRRLMR